MSGYFKDLSDGVISTLKGMSVTMKHLLSKPVTVQYPDEKLPIADAYRGRHALKQQGCRACGLCAKACPVDCIDIETERHAKRVIEFKTFTIDYNKCLFCGLCVEACPASSLEMTKEYDLSTDDRSTLIKDLLAWHGLREEDLENIRLLEAKEREKKEKEAKEAKEKAAGGEAGSGDTDGAKD